MNKLYSSAKQRTIIVETENKKSVAIFASGTGTNAEAIIVRSLQSDASYRVEALLSNNSSCRAMSMAQLYFIDAFHISTVTHPYPPDYDQAILSVLEEYCIDFIALAGYMKKVPPAVIQKYRGRILNIHPALLPKFGGQGMYGMFVHEAVIASKESETGITIHQVDEKYDHGETVFQATVQVTEHDSAESVSAKVRSLELQHYPEIIQKFALSLPEKML